MSRPDKTWVAGQAAGPSFGPATFLAAQCGRLRHLDIKRSGMPHSGAHATRRLAIDDMHDYIYKSPAQLAAEAGLSVEVRACGSATLGLRCAGCSCAPLAPAARAALVSRLAFQQLLLLRLLCCCSSCLLPCSIPLHSRCCLNCRCCQAAQPNRRCDTCSLSSSLRFLVCLPARAVQPKPTLCVAMLQEYREQQGLRIPRNRGKNI